MERLIKPQEIFNPPRGLREAVHRLNQILWEAKHDTLTDAMLADIVDALVGLVPFIGDSLEITRVSDTIAMKDEFRDYRIALYVIDTLIGFVPIVGDLADILLPANTLNFLATRVAPEIRRRLASRYGIEARV